MTTSTEDRIGEVIPYGATRTTVTPSGTMTTLGSPTVGGTDGRSLWRVEMAAGASGPLLACDVELIWTLLAGDVVIELGGVALELHEGDTAVIPGNVLRQVRALTDSRALVVGYASAVVAVPGEQASRDTPEWMS
jgi:quercetin dioxygenase-like cupin family protein